MEDLSDIAAHRCIYETGSDIHGRPIIAFVARNFPAHSIDLNKVCSKAVLFCMYSFIIFENMTQQ